MGLLILKVIPKPIYRHFSKVFTLYLFGPAPGYGEHSFFQVMSKENPRIYLRRIRWLRGIDFAPRFARIRAPAKIWIGHADRLIDPKRQIRALRNHFDSSSTEVIGLDGIGHMLFPALLSDSECNRFKEWLDS
jgi:hypothetical protein